MSTVNPWYVPSRRKGDSLTKQNLYWDDNLMKAAREIAARESERVGVSISGPALIRNLALNRGEFYTEIRRELRARYKQLNKEQHHANTIKNHIREEP